MTEEPPVETGCLDRIEPQGFARVSRSCSGSYGLCPICCTARRQASRHENAEQLRRSGGFGDEKDYRGDTFRAVYTLRYADAVYVLHAFQKKSKTGRETPQRDIELIKQRLREAEQIAKGRKS